MFTKQRALATLSALLLPTFAAVAQSETDTPPSQPDVELVAPTNLTLAATPEYRLHSFSVRWDNDGTYAVPFGASDKHYTNGSKLDLAWTPPADWDDAPDWWLGSGGGTRGNEDAPAWSRFAVGLTLEQHIYTGRFITDPNPPPTDRPYAGYAALGLYAQRASDSVHDHAQLSLGVVGEWSGAERTQKWIHKTFPTQDTPEGWDHQLANEPAVNLTLARTWKTPPSKSDLAAFQFLPSATAELGNVFTRASFDLTFRVGPSLPDDFGPARALTWRDATGTDNGWGDGGLDWYVYTRLGVQAVAWNITLDGNTWKNSRSVDKEPFVGQLEVGIRARYHNLEFGYQLVTTTAEFETQDGPDSYGEVTLTFYF